MRQIFGGILFLVFVAWLSNVLPGGADVAIPFSFLGLPLAVFIFMALGTFFGNLGSQPKRALGGLLGAAIFTGLLLALYYALDGWLG